MKICATVAEYNPFHNGHLKHLNYVKGNLSAEKTIVIMSGNFTQRGEPAVSDKFTRARWAILAGADIVIELPTVFATANAEIFAKGAVKILNDLGVVDGLCFGVESGNCDDYIELASALNNESKEFKKLLKDYLEQGLSFVKAKFSAIKDLGGDYDENLISSPNNILGIEYTRALLNLNSDIDIFPMIRTGNHNDKKLRKKFTSASSIREVLKLGKIKKIKGVMPRFVYTDLGKINTAFEHMIMSALLTKSAKDMAKILDCSEGLENRIKALSKDNKNIYNLVDKCTTKRYTSSRIKRILLSNLLGIEEKFVFDCLSSPLYAKVLAVKKESMGIISELSKNSKIPLLTRKSDTVNLSKTALACYNKDVLACELYSLGFNKKINENNMIIV